MSSRKKSVVWNHFTEVNSNRAECKYCFQVISAKDGSTGNLIRHMRLKHVSISMQRENIYLPSSTVVVKDSTISSSETFASYSNVSNAANADENANKKQRTINNHIRVNKQVPINKSKQYDQQLLKMIVKEYQLFRMVEDIEFRKFVNLLCPGYNLPSRKTILTSLIPNLYTSTKEKIREKLNKAFAVCITTDGWTSINNESFLSVTAHWINEKTELCINLLGCTSFDEQHTAENISNFLKETFQEWNIDDKIIMVISDKADITAAVRHGNWHHLECFDYSLNLVVQTGLTEIHTTIDKVKKIIEFFKRSSHALAKLQQVQEHMCLPMLKLKQDVCTRWNSTYDMLCRILKIKDALLSTLAILSTEVNLLTSSDWTIIEKAVDILVAFNEVTNEINSEKNVSLSKIILLTRSIKRHVEQFYNDSSLLPELHRMADILIVQLTTRFKDIEDNEFITQTTLLDPRFKKFGFSDPKKADDACSLLKNKVCSVNIPASSSHTITSLDIPTPTCTSSLWSEFDELVVKSKTLVNPTAAGIVEVDKYLQEPLISRLQNPLLWWDERKVMYPMLYEVVKKRLCIVATSERIFSKAGQIAAIQKNNLHSSKISQILFLNHNLE